MSRILRCCFLAVAVAFALPLCAADLPAELSGTYVGSQSLEGWQCELRAFEFYTPPTAQTPGSARALSAECQTPDGLRGGAVSTANACPSTEVTRPYLLLAGSGPPNATTPKLRVHSYRSATARCALGEVVVSVDAGPQAVMCRTQVVITTGYSGCKDELRFRRR